ncbi:hypothetical protein [Thermosporothrix hazakensis]|jgi:hypothetical protein|uniref:hypothetical protein n=1 Tax=Thermosporothrix hazakensis TaxID=644383 RepID=UPI0010E624B9|nr:hypothetical protein [Thermosporothrix hazakensis]GCE51484.1 hypothetical protein KTH_63530 [Thermosporothrix hazakensis]
MLSPTAARDYFSELAELGIRHAIFSLPDAYNPETLELLATEVIPAVQSIPVVG